MKKEHLGISISRIDKENLKELVYLKGYENISHYVRNLIKIELEKFKEGNK